MTAATILHTVVAIRPGAVIGGFGADDHMTKPFHKDELVAGIHAIVRRSTGHAQSVVQTGDLVVDARYELTVDVLMC